MNNVVKYLKENGQIVGGKYNDYCNLETFKKITLGEFEDFANKYIAEGLEVGKQYDYNGRDSIHYIIKDNMLKGLLELGDKYRVNLSLVDIYNENNTSKGLVDNKVNNENYLKALDRESVFGLFRVMTWGVEISVDYDLISDYDRIGKYNFEVKKRKNASYSNTTFTLMSVPKFEIYDKVVSGNVEISKDTTIYDLIFSMLENKRKKVIENQLKEIEDLKNQIENCKDMIKKYEEIIF